MVKANFATYDKRHYRRGYWSLFITHLQGVFSDSLFFWLAIYLLTGAARATLDAGSLFSAVSDEVLIGGVLFSLPFVFLYGLLGSLNDRYPKQRMILFSKIFEVIIMALGGIALLQASAPIVWTVVVLLGVRAALFSAAKYAILPEMLPERKLSWGNGFLQAATFAAAVGGGWAAARFFALHGPAGDVHTASVALVLLAVGGVLAARFVSKPPAAHPSESLPLNPFSVISGHVRVFWSDRWLWITALAVGFFWFVLIAVSLAVTDLGSGVLDLTARQTGTALTVLGAGIIVGSVLTGYLSRHKVEVGLVPLGAFGMGFFALLIGLDVFTWGGVLTLLFLCGVLGATFHVPASAVLQQRSPKGSRGGVIASANMVSVVGMILACAVYWLLITAGIEPHTVFLVVGALGMGAGLYVGILMPLFVLRLALWALSNSFYRVRVLGRQNIPEEGGALLVANHSSFLDALVILASIDRPVRFIMYQGIYEVPWIKPLARMMEAIPVTPGGGPREVVQSLRNATEAIKTGDIVCIFAEGQITRTGQMLPFRRGFERIMKGVDAPIIPVHIDQIWGSVFSFADGHFSWKWPNRLPFPITVAYGPPLPSTANAFELRSAILDLSADAYTNRKENENLLHRVFVQRTRRHPFMMAIADGRSGALSYLKALAGSVVLARKLKDKLGPEEMTGVLLPQSVGGALTNIALQFMGKVPVNLNYTASNESIANSAQQCGMKHIVTAKAFLEQMPVEIPGEPIYLEDIMKSVTSKDRIIGLLIGFFLPVKWTERIVGAPRNRSTDDLATIIFSSGSEGVPKGIMLTHFNLLSNIEAAIQVFPHKKGDSIVGILPFFHSFGFTGTLWLVLVRDLSAVYHPNPLEARAIGDLIKQYKGRILFATSTFLQGFIRRCTPDQLESLEHVITGAEKLAPRVRDAFKEKFGVEPLEGYGTTECAPIVSLNVPDFRAPGFYQKGTKRGSIGHPIPGISVRIIDPDTRENLQNGQSGLLLVKGPNVMKGYLNNPEKTSEALQQGWYETGDIATIDEDGFITITDRLARFSKIGGEMVSHTKVEEALHKVINQSERVLAVAGVPDENKGERLVVVHTLADDEFEELMSKLDETGLPNLWIPKGKAFYKIDEIPILGTGKMDLKAVKSLARQLDIGE